LALIKNIIITERDKMVLYLYDSSRFKDLVAALLKLKPRAVDDIVFKYYIKCTITHKEPF